MKNKKKVYLKVAAYAAAVILALWYMLVLWWGQNPQVGVEYRMYYLTHQLSDWPGYGKLTYKLGTKEICTALKDRDGTPVDYTVCRRKGQGWNVEQYEGSVNHDTESFIYYLPDSSSQEPRYEIEVKEFDKIDANAGNASVQVLVNGESIGSFSDKGTYIFYMDSIKKDELLTISFVADNCSFSLWSTRIQ